MLAINNIRLFSLYIPFKISFKHGSAERDQTESVIVEINDANGITGYGESCPRSYVTGESIQTIRNFFQIHNADIFKIKDLEDLQRYTEDNIDSIDANPAAWCAIELALLDLLGKISNKSVESLLGFSNQRSEYRYTAIIGDSTPDAFHKLYHKYREQGFTDFKVKLSSDLKKDQDKISCFSNDEGEITIRADANNIWESVDEARIHLSSLNIQFTSIEEPLISNQITHLRQLSEELDIKIILDESFLRIKQFDNISENPQSWIINVRVSKLGGILRSLQVVKRAADLGIDVVIGAQVGETSLLSRAALLPADIAGDNLFAQEGAFSTLLLDYDPFLPMIQFGRGGNLINKDLYCRLDSGFGLSPYSNLFSGTTDFELLEQVSN